MLLAAGGIFQIEEEQVQRPEGRHVPGVFEDQYSSDSKAESSGRGCHGT